MGPWLSQPITTKHTENYENKNFKVSLSSMQGWRVSMEDAHTCQMALSGHPDIGFFAVFDGHGGAAIANYAAENLVKKCNQQPTFPDGNPEDAFKNAFLELDKEMHNERQFREDMAGSTAVVCLINIKDKKIHCANLGDSRAIVAVNGMAEALSNDHKPTNETEYSRILHAGGWLENGRVNGNLALSRAFGDFEFKRQDNRRAEEQIVIAYPDVIVRPITPDTEFVLIACDGIWDVMTNQEVVDFIRPKLAAGRAGGDIVEDLLSKCLAPDCARSGGLGCDNMTAILVCLSQGQTPTQYQARLKQAGQGQAHASQGSQGTGVGAGSHAMPPAGLPSGAYHKPMRR